MRRQQALGLVLGFFVVGPLVAGLILRGGAGPLELTLGGVVGAVIGYLVAGSLSARTRHR